MRNSPSWKRYFLYTHVHTPGRLQFRLGSGVTLHLYWHSTPATTVMVHLRQRTTGNSCDSAPPVTAATAPATAVTVHHWWQLWQCTTGNSCEKAMVTVHRQQLWHYTTTSDSCDSTPVTVKSRFFLVQCLWVTKSRFFLVPCLWVTKSVIFKIENDFL